MGRSDELHNVAISLSSFLQKMTGVHSVRWRLKSPEHLVSKICRKKAAGSEKYKTISIENYRDVVTDLIGIRVLHLLKEDFSKLHGEIIRTWDVAEEPVAYLRNGDQQDLRDLYDKLGLHVENHADGYRSIHYIILTNFTKNSIKCELQVRTIFEEGWSEIDHMIRYPEFTDEPLVLEFVNIFNRLSGAADEMGTFALKLAKDINRFREEGAQKEAEATKSYEELSAKIEELERAHNQNESLRSELTILRKLANKVQATNAERSSRFISPNYQNARVYLEKRAQREISDSKGNNEDLNRDLIMRLGFSADSFDEVASTSKKSIKESVLRIRRMEADHRPDDPSVKKYVRPLKKIAPKKDDDIDT
ncbi:ppGpp synthetase/RelA/SpoT-type nucleotidyltransferase [Cereibacter johrii]|uniref:PpGpp synthetase/RelA/SpoT-type nucleotidyltransferase n=2 Tax=Cereibacter johrii TaxID=445629 RepID=A0ABX5J450_9RHOB|nr:ppGpp synthetase/RelA/SpoT-type nucleotidyltransferase [Cereibacter johrii]